MENERENITTTEEADAAPRRIGQWIDRSDLTGGPAKTSEEDAAPRRAGRWIDRTFFFNSESVLMLIIKCVILIAIPFAHVWLWGLLNEWLKLYSLVSFIFFTWIFLLVLALASIAYAIIRFIKNRRS